MPTYTLSFTAGEMQSGAAKTLSSAISSQEYPVSVTSNIALSITFVRQSQSGTTASTVGIHLTANNGTTTYSTGVKTASLAAQGGSTANVSMSANTAVDATKTDYAGMTLGIRIGPKTNGVGISCSVAPTFTITTAYKTYTLTTAVSPSGYGTVTSGGSIAYNSKKQLTATANSGYKFSSWSKTAGTLSSTSSNPTTFTMGTSAATVTANFVKQSYALTTAVSPSGGGTVTSGATLEYQAKKQLTATASSGYTFSSWSKTAGTLSSTTSNPTTFTMGAGAATVTAAFTANKYTLTVSKGTGISSVSGGGSKTYGSKNVISATVSTGYTFNKWTSNNGGTFSSATSASTSFTMPVGNTTVTASATINSYTLTTAVTPSGGGTVTAGGKLNYNATKSLTATPATGYSFTSWSKTAGTLSSTTTNPTTFTMGTSNATVTATFTINSYALTTAVSPSGGGTVTAGATMNYNTKKQLTATAATGYTFSSWTKTAGTLSSTTANPTTFTMGAGKATVTANFTINSYTLTTAVSPSDGGTVTAGGSMDYNTNKQLTATASTGYSFSSWSKTAGTLSSTSSNPTTFTIGASNATVTATFTKIDYTITANVSPSEGGTLTSDKATANYDDTVTLTQTTAEGYVFDGYTTSPALTITNNQFTMPAQNVTITANYHLAAVPSTATLSSSSLAGGNSVTMTIDAYSEDYTHRYKVRFNNSMDTGWISLAAGVSSANVYAPIEWYKYCLPGSTANNGILYLETYDENDQKLGDTFEITGLSYTATPSLIPTFNLWRCDASGNAMTNGEYAKYSYVISSSATGCNITYDGTTVNDPPTTGDVLPNDKQQLLIGSNHMIVFSVSYANETFSISKDVAKVVSITKRI